MAIVAKVVGWGVQIHVVVLGMDKSFFHDRSHLVDGND